MRRGIQGAVGGGFPELVAGGAVEAIDVAVPAAEEELIVGDGHGGADGAGEFDGPDVVAGFDVDAIDFAEIGRAASADLGVGEAEIDAIAGEGAVAPDAGFHRAGPEKVAGFGVEGQIAGAVVAGADEEDVARDDGGFVDVVAGELPDFLAGDGVEAVNAVVAGTEINSAIFYRWGTFGVAVYFELPEEIAGFGVKAAEERAGVFVQAFADENAAIDDGGGAIDFLLGGHLPDFLASGGVEAVDEAGAADDVDVGGGDEDAIADDRRGGGKVAGSEGGFAEGPADFWSAWPVDVIEGAGAGLVGAEGGPVGWF